MITRAIRIMLATVVFAVAAFGWAAWAQDAPSVEYKIKAAYLFNFAKFVEWPSNALAAADTPITVGVLGKDPFGEDLEGAIAGKSIEGRPLKIRRFMDSGDYTNCHILFISATERKRLPRILATLKGTSTLTVSEVDQFAQLGGMINFIKVEGNVRFEINLEAAEQAHLKISSKLLKVGIVIRKGSDGGGD